MVLIRTRKILLFLIIVLSFFNCLNKERFAVKDPHDPFGLAGKISVRIVSAKDGTPLSHVRLKINEKDICTGNYKFKRVVFEFCDQKKEGEYECLIFSEGFVLLNDSAVVSNQSFTLELPLKFYYKLKSKPVLVLNPEVNFIIASYSYYNNEGGEIPITDLGVIELDVE